MQLGISEQKKNLICQEWGRGLPTLFNLGEQGCNILVGGGGGLVDFLFGEGVFESGGGVQFSKKI